MVTAKYGWLEVGDIRKGFVNFQARSLEACPICEIKHEKDQLYGYLRRNGHFVLKCYRQKQYKPNHKGLAFGEASGIIKAKDRPIQKIVDRVANAVAKPRSLVELPGKVINVKRLKDDFRDCGLEIGPAISLAKFAKECKEKKKRSFSSYKTQKDLSEVLAKYGIVSGDITLIPQFKPVTQPIDENAPDFKLCIDDILRRIENMGPVVDSNEAMRCEYVSTILHTAVRLLKGLVIKPQANVIGEENTGRVDYVIKKILDDLLEEIICITEGKQNQATVGVCQNLLQCRSACDVSMIFFPTLLFIGWNMGINYLLRR